MVPERKKAEKGLVIGNKVKNIFSETKQNPIGGVYMPIIPSVFGDNDGLAGFIDRGKLCSKWPILNFRAYRLSGILPTGPGCNLKQPAPSSNRPNSPTN